MGLRTTYYKPLTGNCFKDNFIADYPVFREWMLSEHEMGLSEFNERLITEEMEMLLIATESMSNIDLLDQRQVDSLVFEYINVYSDYGKGASNLALIGPVVNTSRYETSTEIVKSTNDSVLNTLWMYLVLGRSIKNDAPFIKPHNEIGRLGFWDMGERELLYEKVTELSDSNTGVEGFKYVLSVLNEMLYHKSDLIFNVE